MLKWKKKQSNKMFKKDDIGYLQGIWKCKIVSDNGRTIHYILLEGVEREHEGQVFFIDSSMIKKEFNFPKRKV